MTNFDGPSLIVPPGWAEVYFDARDVDGARLRAIIDGDPRLDAAGFRDFLERERFRLLILSIYEIGVLIVECRGGPPEASARPWPVETETARRLVAFFRDRAGQAAASIEPEEDEKRLTWDSLPPASLLSGNGAPSLPAREPLLPARAEDPESEPPDTVPPFEPTYSPNPSLSFSDSVPRQIGDYQIVRQIGQGGMGVEESNLMIGPDGSLKLLDLGLAKATSEAMNTPDVTRTGAVMGTPAFMAPEQVVNAKSVSSAADLYAAGSTLFEMLTGRRTFSGPLMEFLHKIVYDPPPDPRQFRPDLPEALAELILRLLAKAQEARPGADAVLVVVRRFASTQFEDRDGDAEIAHVTSGSFSTITSEISPAEARLSSGDPPTEASVSTVDPPSFVNRISRAARNWKESDGDELINLLRGPDGEPRLGEYVLRERLGPPSAISTYRAEMPYSGVSCVVRILPPAFGQLAPDRLHELLREQGRLMRISTRSSHLSGLTFLGRAELSRGALRTVYYTVENFYEGQSLDELVKAKELLGIREGRRALLRAVSALAALHDEQIIHGNIHPGKILVDIERRDLCIVDLSRARRMDHAEPPEPGTQRFGGFNHADFLCQDSYRRRQYLAPEILCDARPHGLASEQYALSVVFIEALTGDFIRTDENDLKLVNLVRAELEDRLDDIAEESPRFAQVFRKMVKPNAESRYFDLRDVREALFSSTRRNGPGHDGRRADSHARPYPGPESSRSDSRSGHRNGPGNGPYDVFLSYRRESGAFVARAMFEALERRGYRVFLDVDRLKSGRFDTKLLLHIQNTPNFIVIMSEGGLDRCHERDDWLRREIAHAIQCRCNILPIMMPGFEMPKPARLPPNIRKLPSFNAIHYEHEHHDGVLEQLQQFIKRRRDESGPKR